MSSRIGRPDYSGLATGLIIGLLILINLGAVAMVLEEHRRGAEMVRINEAQLEGMLARDDVPWWAIDATRQKIIYGRMQMSMGGIMMTWPVWIMDLCLVGALRATRRRGP